MPQPPMTGTRQESSPHLHRPPAYEVVRSAAARIALHRSLLRLEGADAFDFLHRMSTNDMLSMRDGEARRTVIVNEKGRIIDLVTVVRTGDRALVLGSPALGRALKGWFDKFIIMDDVHITGETADTRVMAFYGPQSAALAGRPSGGGMSVREDLGSVPGSLLIPGEGNPGSGDAGPWEEVPVANAATLEAVRIEELVPATGRELGPDVNALEAGLKRYISFSKGCYIGQEVIARLDTYRKLQKILSLFDFPGFDGEGLGPGNLFHDGGDAGRITSTTFSPRHRAWIGLGYRRITARDIDFQFLPGDGNARIPCRCITALPEGYEEYEIQE